MPDLSGLLGAGSLLVVWLFHSETAQKLSMLVELMYF